MVKVPYNIKGFIYRAVFSIGWLLSPLTLWNDAFINIPISYVCASLVTKFSDIDFLQSVLVFYWLSNLLGIGLMFFSGRLMAKDKGYSFGSVLSTAFTIIIYSVILILLVDLNILKPFNIPTR